MRGCLAKKHSTSTQVQKAMIVTTTLCDASTAAWLHLSPSDLELGVYSLLLAIPQPYMIGRNLGRFPRVFPLLINRRGAVQACSIISTSFQQHIDVYVCTVHATRRSTIFKSLSRSTTSASGLTSFASLPHSVISLTSLLFYSPRFPSTTLGNDTGCPSLVRMI